MVQSRDLGAGSIEPNQLHALTGGIEIRPHLEECCICRVAGSRDDKMKDAHCAKDVRSEEVIAPTWAKSGPTRERLNSALQTKRFRGAATSKKDAL